MTSLGIGLGVHRSRPAAAGGFNWSQIFGVGDDGFVFDGSLSRFYTDSAMTTECSVSASDPIGAVEDVSGKGNHLLQTSSGNKGVFYSAGDLKWGRFGRISAIRRWVGMTIAPANAASWSTQTMFAVFAPVGASNYARPVTARSTLDTDYGPTSQIDAAYTTLTPKVLVATSNIASLTALNRTTATPIAYKLCLKPANGLADTGFRAYASLGINFGGGAGTATSSGYPDFNVHSGSAMGTKEFANIFVGSATASSTGELPLVFALAINREITSGEETAVQDYLTEKFSGWAP